MAATTSTTSVPITKAYVNKVFSHLSEIDDVDHRNLFFTKYISPNVCWTMTGTDHALAGTRHTLATHAAATFNRLGRKLVKPIKFNTVRVLVDDETRWACVETRGEAWRKADKPYQNEYVWMVLFDEKGIIIEIRTYCDTKLAEAVILDPEPPEEKA